jgi:hypothetical protein
MPRVVKTVMKFNLQIILIHLFATIFLIGSARQLMNYYNFENFHIVQDAFELKSINDNNAGHYNNTNLTIGELFYAITSQMLYATYIALIISSLISVIIGIKNKISWINSLIVFIGGFIVFRIGFYQTEFAKIAFFSFGYLFVKFGELFYYLTNAIFLLLIGLLIFFNKWTKIFNFNSGNKFPN